MLTDHSHELADSQLLGKLGCCSWVLLKIMMFPGLNSAWFTTGIQALGLFWQIYQPFHDGFAFRCSMYEYVLESHFDN